MPEDIQQEPKEVEASNERLSTDDIVENYFKDKSEPSEQKDESQEASSPEKSEPVDTDGSVSDTPKTDKAESEADFEGTPKGFASHPAWQKRETKLKDTLKELDDSKSQLSQLLDDPLVYKRSLERQGKTQEEIIHEMQKKGMDVSNIMPQASQAKQDVFDQICEREGWDKNRLEDGQKSYLTDIFRAMDNHSRELIKSEISKEIGPIQEHMRYEKALTDNRTQYNNLKERAKQEFHDLNWEKDIEPAMSKYLDKIEEIDPKGENMRPSITELYERATRQILIDQVKAKGSQEVRDKKKINSTPLRPGANSLSVEKPLKGKNVRETTDLWLQQHGVN